ncbi:E3 ubiquitin-protein ligase PPP1R11-like [Teleopsis dalmanni]|uniref:E3 ubiquitin-protein ligase PPP1R11 n=1 Tax=Teleopsis dalmanni TaxID=139649 RepID=UPI0018CE9624|nr:E3 ubiquitin-protein ligase PPP1R11 [Teleopsis dalmanni]XP_037960029.1 E3 ubiquitin-protein ligase PPP1R11-like [Teleopsis dalmanni]
MANVDRVDNVVSSQTQLVGEEEVQAQPPVLRLRLKKPKSKRSVAWREDTVDNEHANKKKSKCCCIFRKQHEFGESSSESDDDCENCFGHPEKRKKNQKPAPPEQNDLDANENNNNDTEKDNN